jgi:hypothetical protein
MRAVGYGAYGMKGFGSAPNRSVSSIISNLKDKLRGRKKGYKFLHGLGQEFAPSQKQIDAAKTEWKAAIKALNKAKSAPYSSQEAKTKGIARAQSRFEKARKTLALMTEEAAEEADFQVTARAERRAARTKKAAAPAAPAAAPPPPTTPKPTPPPPLVLPPPPPRPGPADYGPPPMIEEDASFGFGPTGNLLAAGAGGLLLAALLFRRR